MPRIDPQQLLTCLAVLLSRNGGIRSASEVQRLADLMVKYSKKLVSKCIYIQILKNTDTELLGKFMAAGGWSLTHMWFADGILSKNWPLVQEILELLLLCPVDVNRLKSNSSPKLVKGLSKDGGNDGVRILATKLVEQWLKLVKGESTTTATTQPLNATSVIKSTVVIDNNNIQQQQQLHHQQQQQLQHQQQQQLQHQQQQQQQQQEQQHQQQQQQQQQQYQQYQQQQHEQQQQQQQESQRQQEEPEQSEEQQTVISPATVFINSDESNRNNDNKTINNELTEDPLAVEEDHDTRTKKDKSDIVHVKDSKEIIKSDALVYKITLRDGKQILAKVESPPIKKDNSMNKVEYKTDSDKNNVDKRNITNDSNMEGEKAVRQKENVNRSKSVERSPKSESKKTEEQQIKNKKSTESSSYRRSSHSSSSKYSSSSSKSKSSSSSSSSYKSSSSSSKDKYRDKDKDKSRDKNKDSIRDKDKYKSYSSKSNSNNNTSSSSSNSSNSNRDKTKNKSEEKLLQTEKDKESLSKITSSTTQSSSLHKLGKIPKKINNDSSSDDASKSSSSSQVPSSKKQTMSIEVRKDSEKRPKTAKTFHSQFRNHGLAEEAPPPPSRRGLKKPVSTTVPGTSIPSNLLLKRSSPPPLLTNKDGASSIEKKIKLDSPTFEKPGAIKLIPPKPKPSVLVESDMFMDALSAATTKLDVNRKRKRLPSISKESPTLTTTTKTSAAATNGSSATIAPTATTTTNSASTTSGLNSDQSAKEQKLVGAPMKFYQDTLDDNDTNTKDENKINVKDDNADAGDDDNENNDNKDIDIIDDDDGEPLNKRTKSPDNENKDENNSNDSGTSIKEPTEIDENNDKENEDITTDAKETIAGNDADDKTIVENVKRQPGPGCGPNGPPGVLVIHRRKDKPKKQIQWKEALEEVRFFELDEDERVNVTKTFVDMKQMERCNERESFLLARKLNADDTMVEQTVWAPLMLVDDVPAHPLGANSREKKIQLDREKTCLKALYFNRLMIPSAPAEPDMEQYQITEPQIIPLDDITGNADAVNDFTNVPWPDSKGSPPPHIPMEFADEHMKLLHSQFNNNNNNNNNNNMNSNNIYPYNGPPQLGGLLPGQWNNIGAPQMNNALLPSANNISSFPIGNNYNGPPPDLMNQMISPPPINSSWIGPHPPSVMSSPPNYNTGPTNNSFNNYMHSTNNNRDNNSNTNSNSNNSGSWNRFNNNTNRESSNNWRNGGGGDRYRKRLCKSFQKGYCRHGDKCNFLHPGINCPSF